MAHIVDLAAQMDWTGLAEGEVRVVPLLHDDAGVRVRMLVTRRAVWPKHVEARAEAYIILKGDVVYIAEREQRVKAGEAIVLAPGEPHGARVDNGAVSINVDFDQRRP